MSLPVPEESPFASREFAGFWHGWQGRSCRELEVDGFSFPYVMHRHGPLFTYAALPFGIPVLVNDAAPAHQAWIRRFFALGRSVHSSLAIYEKPSALYDRVRWVRQDRAVIVLDASWSSRVKSSALRKVRQAERAGWSARELELDELARTAGAVEDTDRRHDISVRFPASELRRLRALITEPGRLMMWGAVRGDEVGGLWVIFRSGTYETGWLFYTTDTARGEGVGPLLTHAWIERSAAAGIECIDLGASPSAGVRRFKETFGAQPAPLYCGIRRWHLWGT